MSRTAHVASRSALGLCTLLWALCEAGSASATITLLEDDRSISYTDGGGGQSLTPDTSFAYWSKTLGAAQQTSSATPTLLSAHGFGQGLHSTNVIVGKSIYSIDFELDTATSFEIVGENTSQGTGGSITVRLSSLNPTNTILNAFGSYSLSTTLQPGTYRLYALAQGTGYDGSVTFDFDATLEELPPPVPVFGALGHGLSAASLAIAGVLAGRMARRASSDMRS